MSIEDAIKAVEDEPEFTDEMPDEMWQEMQTRDGATIAFRFAVMMTKRNIIERLKGVKP